MSGLSTTGNISLGLAFVAGRKRVPRPATGNTAVRIAELTLIQRSCMCNAQGESSKSAGRLVRALGPFEYHRMQTVPRTAFGAAPVPADARQAAIVALVASADIPHAHEQGTQRGDLLGSLR